MLSRVLQIAFILISLAGYAAEAVSCFGPQQKVCCNDEHDGQQQSPVCGDCVCHMPAHIFIASSAPVFVTHKPGLPQEQHRTILRVIAPDLRPPRSA